MFDVVFRHIGIKGIEDSNLTTRPVLLCIVKAIFVNQTWCNEIIFGYMGTILYICSQK